MAFVDGIYIYSQKYYHFLLSQVKDIIMKNPKPTPSMFNHLDILHPGGHYNFQQFLSKYPLSSSSKVFEIGCGLGGTTRFLVQNTGCFVHAIDLLPHYVQIAKIISQSTNQLSNISFNQGNINTYPIQENKYDLAFEIAAFHVINELDGYKTIAKSLKPGGLFYFEDYISLKKKEDFGANDLFRIQKLSTQATKTKDIIFSTLEQNGMELLEFIDISAQWSEFAWVRAEGMQEQAKITQDDPNPEASNKIMQYGCLIPGLMRHLEHIPDEQLEKRFPLTLQVVGGISTVKESPSFGAGSMVWKKK